MTHPLSASDDHYEQTFRGLKAAGEPLNRVRIESCQFIDCDFSASVWRSVVLQECQFIRCNLGLWQLPYSELASVQFEDCKLLGVDWTRAAWPDLGLTPRLQFRRCLLDDSTFFGLALDEMVLTGCQARDVDFRDCHLRRADLRDSDLAHSLFGNTDLRAANLTEARDYDIDLRHNQLKGAKFSRFEALRLLDSLEIELVD